MKKYLPMLLLSGASTFALASMALSSEPAARFSHGVASGDVTHHDAVLWTRVDRAAEVEVEVALDEAFQSVIMREDEEADAKNDFTVKIHAEELPPAHTLYYRFHVDGLTSEVGSFRTAPAPGRSADVKLAFSADADGTHVGGVPFFNNFEVLDAVRAEGADAFIYLGDTIYADSFAAQTYAGRAPAVTLDEYRALYKENLSIAALPALLKSTSTIAVWDDHEVYNDYDAVTVDPVRFANGRKAFLEYMPINEERLRKGEGCAGRPLARRFRWGRDVEVIVLDERSCRSPSAAEQCQNDLGPTLPPPVRAQLGAIGISGEPPAGCLAALYDPSRTMLGTEQKRWFKKVLKRSKAKYKLVVNEVGIQQLYALPYDRWEGYAAERNEILSFIRDNQIDNVIFLTTDLHTSIMNEVFVDRFLDPAPIAYEFITGPIATFSYAQEIDGLVGPAGVVAFNQVLNMAGVDCRNNNTNSYGVFAYDAASGQADIVLKDASGAVVRDELNPGIECRKSFP